MYTLESGHLLPVNRAERTYIFSLECIRYECVTLISEKSVFSSASCYMCKLQEFT